MDTLKTITICDNPFIADVIRQALADNGIACMVVDQTVLGVNGGYGPMPGHAIRVYQKDAEQAQTIVDDILQNR